MSELYQCDECGREYNEPVARNLCGELERHGFYHYVNVGSRTWDRKAVQEVIRSLAVTGPREYVEVEASWSVGDYRVVLPDHRVEIRDGDEWESVSENALTSKAMLSGFDAGRVFERGQHISYGGTIGARKDAGEEE